MNVEMMNVEEVIPYKSNPRNNDDAVEYVKNSIEQFGFKVPIVIDKHNIIVAGHTRHKASLELGLKEVPVIKADDLTDEQVNAFRIADNKVSEIAEWDEDKLQEELEKIEDIDMSDFGFDEEEMPDFEPVDSETQPSLDTLDPVMVTCPDCGHVFDARDQI